MARKTGEQLKEGLLLLFIVISVTLVGLIWVDGLGEPAEETPAYVRGVPTMQPSGNLPPVAVTATPAPEATPTSLPSATPTATITEDNLPEPTVDPFDVTQDE
ncbi:hypothetical protein GC175_16735 [bacterium]|nr:hypothetical protein [bacterium]